MMRLVFSRDRALQLHAFLRSYARYVRPLDDVDVLYLATTVQHAQAYAEVLSEFPWVRTHVQSSSFRADVLRLLPVRGTVVCFVDDMVFIRSWIVRERVGLSLRLSPCLTHDYPTGLEQPLPVFRIDDIDTDCMQWTWAAGQGSWGYPISLDGHVFDVDQLAAWVRQVSFSSPNTLESALQVFSTSVAYPGICYRWPRIVNIPWNRVQKDYPNRVASSGLSPDRMREAWEAGMQLSLDELAGIIPVSAHQEFSCVLEPR